MPQLTCGDGVVQSPDECDDDNESNTDGCTNACEDAVCGDGFVWEGEEQCDPATPASADLCSRACLSTAWALWPLPNPSSAENYDTGTSGVVTDNVTGLVWQRIVDAGSYTLAAAKTYCAGLTLAGHSDWRLPSRIELVSLVDYTIAEPGPTINATAFPSTPSEYFWTSSLGINSLSWFVYFSNGNTTIDVVENTYRVRCVR